MKNNNIFIEAKNKVCIKSAILSLLPRGKREGKYWVALNPTRNDDHLGSFKVNTDTGRFYDYATNEGGDIISLYAYLKGCSRYKAAYELLGRTISFKNKNMTYTPPKAPKPSKVLQDTEQYINKIWNETFSAKLSIVEKYLNCRGYTQEIPNNIRYHPNLYHQPTKQCFPAMIAAITIWQSDQIQAIHRTYLKADGSGKASSSPNKMMLGATKGSCDVWHCRSKACNCRRDRNRS